MSGPRLLDNCFQVNVGAVARGEARIEGHGRLTVRLADFVGFQGALDNVGDRTVFAPSEPMSRSRALALRTESCGWLIAGLKFD
jgi:hypothetical protein